MKRIFLSIKNVRAFKSMPTSTGNPRTRPPCFLKKATLFLKVQEGVCRQFVFVLPACLFIGGQTGKLRA